MGNVTMMTAYDEHSSHSIKIGAYCEDCQSIYYEGKWHNVYHQDRQAVKGEQRRPALLSDEKAMPSGALQSNERWAPPSEKQNDPRDVIDYLLQMGYQCNCVVGTLVVLQIMSHKFKPQFVWCKYCNRPYLEKEVDNYV